MTSEQAHQDGPHPDVPVPDDVAEYLRGAPEKWHDLLGEVFDAVAEAMPAGYELGMHWGMPTWVIPLDRFPKTYNKQPLAYVSIGAKKNYVSVYLMGLYSEPAELVAFQEAWRASTGKIDMGKSCLRVKSAAEVDRELLAATVAGMPAERFIDTYVRIQAQ